MARAGNELATRVSEVQRTLFGLSGHVLALLGSFGLLASMHPALVLLSVLTVVPGIVVRRKTSRELHALWTTRTPESREQDYLGEILSKPRWGAKCARSDWPRTCTRVTTPLRVSNARCAPTSTRAPSASRQGRTLRRRGAGRRVPLRSEPCDPEPAVRG